MSTFEFELPAIQGTQAGRAYFVTMCPLELLPRLFPDGDDGLKSELQAHRVVNPKRIPEISRYVTDNLDSYVLPALTASVNTSVEFSANTDGAGAGVSAGVLRIPMSATFTLHDGLHRCAALKTAVLRNRKLQTEAVALVIFVDPEGKREDQIFTDLKRHERKSPRSLSILHDDRDEMARLTREIIPHVHVFAETTETTKTTISNRSRKLFTLSAIYHANKLLVSGIKEKGYEERRDIVVAFWNAVAGQIPAWSDAANGKIAAATLRADFIHAHGIGLAALARAGGCLFTKQSKDWKRRLARLKTLDWSRSNTTLWEGRAMIGGRLSKASSCIVLAGNAIKTHLGLELDEEEQDTEDRFLARDDV